MVYAALKVVFVAGGENDQRRDRSECVMINGSNRLIKYLCSLMFRVFC